MFTPAFCEHFFGLPLDARLRLLDEYRLASNGVSPALLQQLYQRMYEIEFLEGRGRAIRFHVGHEMVGLARDGAAWRLTLRDRGETLPPRQLEADVVILCTGWENRFPPFLEPIRPRVSWSEGGFAVRRDFSIEWDGPEHTRIYVQNAARRSHGVAEPNLSIMAWRSATIINSLAGRRVYDVSDPHTVFQWEDAGPLVPEGAAR
jgi:lysine N6-hydroxylase